MVFKTVFHADLYRVIHCHLCVASCLVNGSPARDFAPTELLYTDGVSHSKPFILYIAKKIGKLYAIIWMCDVGVFIKTY